MRAVVVYESIFGNTRALAEAIAEGLRGRFAVTVAEVSHAPTALVGVDLLVVGGPIHAWTMSREVTRKLAREQAAAAEIDPPSAGIGVREYLKNLPEAQGFVAAAAFDSALRKGAWFPTGSAAKPAARRLEARGYRLLVKPEHFYVTATGGPLEPGELERARTWAVGLADAFVRAS
ncbi:MAG: flavodoxin domain-containing protein [Enhygromyxa sp.]